MFGVRLTLCVAVLCVVELFDPYICLLPHTVCLFTAFLFPWSLSMSPSIDSFRTSSFSSSSLHSFRIFPLRVLHISVGLASDPAVGVMCGMDVRACFHIRSMVIPYITALFGFFSTSAPAHLHVLQAYV